MVYHDLFSACVSLVSILGATPNHLPPKYRRRSKIMNQSRYIYLKVRMGEDEGETITTVEEENGKGGRKLH